jgi:glycosyltransferase involved in cell wall biosynthesis
MPRSKQKEIAGTDMRISVCVIGLNEEDNISDCLESVAGIADEIVFVDSNSTDRTIALVKKFTQKVFVRKFDGYVTQKNFAAVKASHDWILNIDCDERLSPELAASIRAIKENPPDEIHAFRFNRLTWYIYRFIRHSGWYPDAKIRLYHRRHCSWQGDKVHEIVEAPDAVTRHLQGDLLHYSFRSIDDHLETIRKYSEMAAQAMYARGRRVSLPGAFARAGWVLFRKFFFELSFLDGSAGIIITWYSAAATFTKYVKLYVLNKTSENNKRP